MFQKVALSSALVHDLAGTGQTECLLGPAMGLHLRHFIPPCSYFSCTFVKKFIAKLLELQVSP